MICRKAGKDPEKPFPDLSWISSSHKGQQVLAFLLSFHQSWTVFGFSANEFFLALPAWLWKAVQNYHRAAWVERDLEDHPVPTSLL